MGAGWFYTPKQMLHYFATRFTTLRPPRTKLQNPYAVLRTLDRHEWSMLLVGFAAWTVDCELQERQRRNFPRRV